MTRGAFASPFPRCDLVLNSKLEWDVSILAYVLRAWSPMIGEAWWQEAEVTLSPVSEVGEQRERMLTLSPPSPFFFFLQFRGTVHGRMLTTPRKGIFFSSHKPLWKATCVYTRE